MIEFIDVADLNKKSEEYQSLALLNYVVEKRKKNEPSPESKARTDEAVRLAKAHFLYYINEDGDYDKDLEGNPIFEEPTKHKSMMYAFRTLEASGIKLTDVEKKEFRGQFFGAGIL